MTKKTVIIAVSVVALIALTYFAYVKIKKALTYADASPTSIPIDEAPTMVIDVFKLEETEGLNSEWMLTAQKAEMFKKSGRIIFNKVDATVNGDAQGKTNYKINSDQGAYIIDEDKIILEKNVVITTSQGYKIITEMLEYYSKSKKINTPLPVSVSGKSPSGQVLNIDGVGISGDLGTGDFKIAKKISTKLGPKLEISSEKAEFNTNSNKVIFEKDITAKKDGLDIKGEKLVVSYSSTGEIKNIEVSDGVKIKIGKKYALCDHALIKGGSSEVVLTGKPEFHAGRDVMVGQKIVFFADSDEVYVEKVKAEVTEDSVRKKK